MRGGFDEGAGELGSRVLVLDGVYDKGWDEEE